MQRNFAHSFIKLTTMLVFSAFAAAAFSQSTTSSIRGKVLDANGAPLANVEVVVTDTRTGATRRITSNDSGTFLATNLVVGGPFVVTANNETAVTVDNIALGDVYKLTIGGLSAAGSVAAGNIEEVVVTSKAISIADVASGPSAVFTLADLEDSVSFNRDIKDVFSNDPRINLDNPNRGTGVNCGGKNPRFNGISIDGVSQNDRFGLNANGYATANGQPFPFDSISSVSVELAPFDVTYGGFSACSINAVTKSGQNEFFGKVFYEYSSDSLRGDRIVALGNSVDVESSAFTEETLGFEVGGPIINDKLFFYASYEKTDEPRFISQGFSGSGSGTEREWLSQSDYNRILDVSNRLYGYDPGGQPSNGTNDQEKLLARIDWDINDQHRASFIYNRFEGVENRSSDGDSFEFEFSNHFYDKGSDLDTYVLKLNSNWNDRLSTEVFLGRNELDDSQVTVGDPDFGDFQINIGRDKVYLGADDSRQGNDLNYTSNLIKLNMQYLAGDHVITAGFERDELDVFNLFVQHSRGGELDFFDDSGRGGLSGIDKFEQGLPDRIYYGSGGGTNNVNDAAAKFKSEQTTFYIQDEYFFENIDLTVVGGLRYERFGTDDKPAFNQAFTDLYGFANDATVDGVDILMPRVGFTWNKNDTTTIRGGAGLFSGGNPNVWISNSYSNDGITNVQLRQSFGDSLFDLPLSGAGRPGFDVPQALIDGVASVTADDAATSRMALVDPNYKQPNELKIALGATIDLPKGFTLDTDLLYSIQRDSAVYRDIAQQVTGFTAAGSPILSNVVGSENFMLTNSNRDADTLVLSASVNKKWDNGLETTFGYAYTDAEDISGMNSSVAFSNFTNVATLNPNDPLPGTSEFETQNRFTFRLNYKTELFSNLQSSVSVYGVYKDGQSTSFSQSGDGVEANNRNRRSLLYVPMSNDGAVVYDERFDRQAFDSFISSEGLARGQFVRRGSASSRSSGRIDLRIDQELPGFGGLKPKVFLKINNVLNMLSSDWGAQYDAAFVSEQVVESSVNGAGQFVFEKFNTPETTDLLDDISVWAARIGLEVRF